MQVNEPTIEQSINILNGLKEKYEKYHQVSYSDEAIKACVILSNRYIQDRYLPDKAIDLMDEAGSKLNLTLVTGNEEELKQRLTEIEQEKQTALTKEDYETAATLRDEEEKLEQMLQTENKHSQPIVDITHIQAIIEKKTGIPVGKLQENEQQKMKNIEENLAKKSNRPRRSGLKSS